jgi:hypothetical protein
MNATKSTRRQLLLEALDRRLRELAEIDPQWYQAALVVLDRMVRRAGGARTSKKLAPNASQHDKSKRRAS